MSKHPPPLPPGWGHPEPTGRAAPPPRRADDGRSPERVQFPANSRASGRRGAAERRRGSAPGEGGGRPCHAEAAHPHTRESWRTDRVFFPGEAGPAAPPPSPDRESAPWRRAARRSGPGSPVGRGFGLAAEPGGALRACPLLVVPLTAGRGRPATPDRPWRRPTAPRAGPAEACAPGPLGIPPAPQVPTAVDPLQARPPAPTGLPAGLNKHPLLWERSPRASLQNLSSVNHGSSDFLIPGY